jgi:hypothetical protein
MFSRPIYSSFPRRREPSVVEPLRAFGRTRHCARIGTATLLASRTVNRPHSQDLDEDDAPPATPRAVRYGRLVTLIAMTLWSASIVLDKLTDIPTVLHLTVILFHEAGHVVFAPFGEALRVAGGTLGQLLIPLICAIALFRRNDRFGAAICLAWMSLSLIDAGVYAYDAADPILPLIGGGTGADSFHDFVFLFDRYGQLEHAHGWARAMKAVGTLGALISLTWAAVVLRNQAVSPIE